MLILGRIRLFILAFFLLFISFNGNSQKVNLNTNLVFENITIEQGLSHIGLTDIYQDSEGFIWICSYDGLNRFDGEKFNVYKHDPDDSSSLLNNRVRCVIEHSNNKLYVGTEEGICVYNRRLDKFEKTGIPQIDNKKINISALYVDSKNRLWILPQKGRIIIMDFQNDTCVSLPKIKDENNAELKLRNICEDPNGNFWIATSKHLVYFPSDLDKKNSINFSQFYNDSEIDFYISRFDKEGFMWVGSSSGAYRFEVDYSSGKPKLHVINHFLDGQDVHDISINSKNTLWLTSYGKGLYRVGFLGKTITNIEQFSNRLYDEGSIKSNYVFCVLEDNSGNIWAGTSEKGICLLKNRNFEINIIDRKNGLKEDYITSLLLFDSTTMLGGTRKSNIFAIDLRTNEVTVPWFEINMENDQVIVALYKDSREILWVGTSSGLMMLKPGGKKLVDLQNLLSESNRKDEIQSLEEDDKGNIWAGTSNGLICLQINEQNEVSNVLEFNVPEIGQENIFNYKVKTLYNDPLDTCIWVGTWYDGLYKIDLTGEKNNISDFNFISYKYESGNELSLRSNFITGILRDSKSRLWVTTEGGGFSRMIEKKDSCYFVNYTQKDGLSNNVAKAIIEDRNGNFYIPTNVKLNLFNPDKETFIYFSKEDGLASEYFNNPAILLPDGRFVFAGNSGISIINPETKLRDSFKCELHFGDFYLNGNIVKPDNESKEALLSQRLDYTPSIQLKHYQNNISIELIAMNWNYGEDVKIHYKLIGYDNDWIQVNGPNFVPNYIKLPYGDYTFQFAVSSNGDKSFLDSRSINVSIAKPLWLTNAAILLYVLVAFSIMFFVYYYIIQIQKLKHNVKIEKLEKEKEHEVTETKLKFFTDITHELRTPLTLISGPLEYLFMQFTGNDNIRHNLNIIKKQVNYLLLLFDQLLEFRRIENGKTKLKIQKINIVDFIWQIKMGFYTLAVKKNISFDFKSDSSEINLWLDSRKIEKIIYNILSNAFKYTPDNGSITIKIENYTEKVLIIVEDSGPGIDENELELIFNRFYQSNKSNIQGTGIGLFLTKSLVEYQQGKIRAYNKSDKGAVFEIKFLHGKEHFNIEDISDEENVLPSELYLPDDLDSNKNIQHFQKENLPVMFIIDDVAEMRDFIEQIFIEDFKTIKFENGKTAYDQVLTGYPDLIISDVSMPVMDGLELCEKIKSDERTNHIPFLLLTSKKDLEYNLKGFDCGADDFISKPFSNKLLKARVTNILKNKQILKRRYNDKFVHENLPKNAAIKDEEFLFTIVQLLEKHIGNSSFDNSLFCEELKLSKTGLYSEIKRITGKTPNALIRDYRFKKAIELLKNNEYTISEIISICGFESRAYFYKCFKEEYDMTPKEFREINLIK